MPIPIYTNISTLISTLILMFYINLDSVFGLPFICTSSVICTVHIHTCLFAQWGSILQCWLSSSYMKSLMLDHREKRYPLKLNLRGLPNRVSLERFPDKGGFICRVIAVNGGGGGGYESTFSFEMVPDH